MSQRKPKKRIETLFLDTVIENHIEHRAKGRISGFYVECLKNGYNFDITWSEDAQTHVIRIICNEPEKT